MVSCDPIYRFGCSQIQERIAATYDQVLDQTRANAVDHAGVVSETSPDPVLTYLANAIRSGDRQVPYSLVTAFASPETSQSSRVVRPKSLPELHWCALAPPCPAK